MARHLSFASLATIVSLEIRTSTDKFCSESVAKSQLGATSFALAAISLASRLKSTSRKERALETRPAFDMSVVDFDIEREGSY